MPKMKLTEKSIARLRAPTASGKQIAYWDDTLRGFGVLCSGVSNKKSYVVQRDLPNGKTRRITLGSVAELSQDAARDKARETLQVMRGGTDPKDLLKNEITLSKALDAYLKARADYLRPASVRTYNDAVHKHLADWLDMPLRNITREMVEGQLVAIAKKVATRNGNGNATANLALRAFRVIYNFALDRSPPSNPLPPNPVRLKRLWLPVESRTRRVTDDDLKRFYKAVTDLENKVHRDYLLLILFTGFRRNEAAALRWDEVDFKSRIIRLPASRAKAKRKLDLPMSDLVHDLLVARRRIGDAKWVFPANSKSGHLEEPKSLLRTVADATGFHVSVHDLRRTFVTVASKRVEWLVLKALVNHSLGKGVTEGYIQISAEQLREPVQAVADEFKRLIGIAPPTGANITRLKG
jgi:integrase